MKAICRITAGSRLYGLDTPDSDSDTRGVFLSTKPSEILGLDRQETIKREDEDLLLFEFRHFLRGLRKTNTQMVELLFAEDSDFSLLEGEFGVVRENRLRLLDSRMLFKSLVGYIHNERRLANGDRTGNLGSKRKQSLERYGFSPKNFSHLLRLAYCGRRFFETDNYPVKIVRDDPEFRDFLFSVKTEPGKHSKDRLNELSDEAEEGLKKAFDSRRSTFEFDEVLANRLCLEFYLPFLRL